MTYKDHVGNVSINYKRELVNVEEMEGGEK